MICRLFGHRYWRKEQVSPWSYSRIEYDNCVRCGQ